VGRSTKLLGRVGALSGALMALALGLAPAQAGSLKVNPVLVTLGPDRPTSEIRIGNDGVAASRIQMRLYEWHQVDDKEELVETRDLLINPPMFEIVPGQTQMARLGFPGMVDAGASERSYRLLIEEVPSATNAPGQIQTLLRISIPVFLAPADVKPELDWRVDAVRPDAVELSIANHGRRHVRITQIALVGANGGKPVGHSEQLLYVLPGARKTAVVPTSAAGQASDGLVLRITTSDGVVTMPAPGASDARASGH
jgi:fimbrial chaperone protein